jgi:hypothetical protein
MEENPRQQIPGPFMKITLVGIVVFLVLAVAFLAWFGGRPISPDDSSMTQRGIMRSWFYCSLLFIAGAGTACFGDKEYGMFPPTSLRWLFIVFGMAIMGISIAWMHSLVKAWADREGAPGTVMERRVTSDMVGGISGFTIGPADRRA